MRREVIILCTTIVLVAVISLMPVWAGEINYNRQKATEYASYYCSTDSYNHDEYKCWNGTLPECENHPSKGGNGQKTDCTNFASQASIAGGLTFNGCYGSTDIGKGGKAGTRGMIGVHTFLAALTRGSCFNIVDASSKAVKKGDFVITNNGSHVVTVADPAQRYYYGHTSDRCSGSYCEE